MNKEIELHTIATFQGKEYELENLLNGLLNKLEEKDKEIEKLNNIIDELEEWFKEYHKSKNKLKWNESDYIEFIEHLENELKEGK